MPAFVTSAVHRPTGLIAIGRRLGGFPCDVRLCTIEGGNWVEKHTLPLPDVTFAMDFDPSALRVLATTEKGLFIFDVATGELVVRLDVPCERAVFLADSGHIAAIVQKMRKGAETLDELTIFEIPSGKVVKVMPSRMRLNALAISPDRTRLAIGGDEQVVRILDAATLEERTNFRAHDLGITSIAFHPTRAAIATASSDDSVKLWNLENSALERTFLGFDATPVMVAFSPSGHLLSVEGQEEMWRLFELGADSAGGKGK
jgi:WD40 repeat protein